jgi:hypothetical protein
MMKSVPDVICAEFVRSGLMMVIHKLFTFVCFHRLFTVVGF